MDLTCPSRRARRSAGLPLHGSGGDTGPDHHVADVTPETTRNARMRDRCFPVQADRGCRLLDTIASLIAKRATAHRCPATPRGTLAVINPATLSELGLISTDSTFMPEPQRIYPDGGAAAAMEAGGSGAVRSAEGPRARHEGLGGHARRRQLCRTCVGIHGQTASELQASAPRVPDGVGAV